jgi:tetrapyrrole methylase family protein/MazG family protein
MTKSFDSLCNIIARLRDPVSGCPWDKEQTHSSLKPYVIEEAYEVVDAIDESPTALKKELGDLLLQVMLHSQIASEADQFSAHDVVEALITKLIDRHPHIFSDTKAGTSKEVLENWEKLKAKEKDGKESVLSGVPKTMPALLRAQRVSEKAARVGFEWTTFGEIKAKVLEEVKEFAAECNDQAASKDAVEDEFGDVLFSLVQLSRRMGFDAEAALQKSTNKFVRRFQKVEERVKSPISETAIEELDRLWNAVKKEEKEQSL